MTDKEENTELRRILTDLRDRLDDVSDVVDSPGGPRPNMAMRLMQYVDDRLEELKAMK